MLPADKSTRTIVQRQVIAHRIKENTKIMTHITIDRDMLINDLYDLRAMIPSGPDGGDSRKRVDDIIRMVSYAPLSEQKSNFPRPIGSR